LYESEESVLAGLGHVWKRVGELAAIEPSFAGHLDQRDAIKAQLEDLAFALRDYAGSIDASPGRLEQVEERLALVERLKRKHGPTLDEVIQRRDALAEEHRALSGAGADAAEIEVELAAASASYLTVARRLSDARGAAAAQFASAMERELADLAMARTRFEVRLARRDDPAGWTERGMDAGEFYISPNPGEEVRPLARIVSGGELSRVMLALKTLAAADATSKTLIFDEIDAGIGGRVATVVGDKLRALGARFQVLCISHLPQIAATASAHFHIEKRVRGARTTTAVARLQDEERIEELARMLAGAAVGESSRATARELLSASQVREGVRAKGEAAGGRKRK
jgi:DNA repair protein RecN (Recombination protein N)